MYRAAHSRRFHARYLLTAVFYFFLLQGNAQQWLPNFRHFTTNDGLPTSEVYQITSDSQKNIWFATDRGAVRYDGYSFRTYDNKDSLPDNSIIKLYRDYAGKVWFISYNGLLSYYQDEKIIPYKYNNILSRYFSNTIVTSLYVDHSESVHLNFIDAKSITITASGHLINNTVKEKQNTYSVNAIDSGSAIPSTVYGKDTSHAKIIVIFPDDTVTFILKARITYEHFAALKLRNNDVVFYCDRYVIRIRHDGSYKVAEMDAPVLNVMEDTDNDFWVGVAQNGVYLCDSLFNVKAHYLKEITITHIFRDFEGGYWLSSQENGIFYLSAKNNSLFATGDKPLNERITDVFNMSDSILFFTASKGQLYQYSNNSFSILDLKKDLFPDLTYLYSVNYNYKYRTIFTGGLMRNTLGGMVNTRKWHNFNILLSCTLTKLYPLSNGTFLGTNYFFIFNLDKNGPLQKSFLYLPERPTAVFEDSKKRIFVGTLSGLYTINGNQKILLDSTRLPKFRITCINEINNNLIIGTRSNGILIYNDSIVKKIGISDGLTSDNINCFTVENNVIWAGTNKGINKITILSQSPFTFSINQLNSHNGLISDEVNEIAVSKDMIYVATNDGFSRISKDNIKYRSAELPFYITSVSINGRDTAKYARYFLGHQQNNIDISYTGISLRDSKNIIYRYRLTGLDSTWRTTTNRDVHFSNLESGNYTFELLASRENNSYTGKPLRINFSIQPSLFETTRFRLSAILGVLFILLLIIQQIIKNIREKADRETALNKKISELNLNALRSQMNPHFTFNVLNSIKYYIANKDAESAQFYISKFAKLIRLILDQSRSDFIPLSEEIRMLALYMELEELRFENKFTYSIHIDSKLNTDSIFIPGMLIQPFVENSIKHGIKYKKGEATVHLEFRSNGNLLTCTITDNGIGREAAEKYKSEDENYKSAGTSIVNERMEALSILFNGKLKNYTFDLKDEKGNPSGTCVNIEIPYRKTL